MTTPVRQCCQDHDEANRESRARLERLTAQLDSSSLQLRLGEGWTVGAGIMHLAFWDRYVHERWRHAARRQLVTPQPVEDHVTDLINDALTPLLLVVAVELAPAHSLEAARAVDALIAELPTRTIEAIIDEGRPRLINRSLHRREHLDGIEAALSPASR